MPAEGSPSSVRPGRAAPGRGNLALRLLTESADPAVRPVVERVTARRLAVIESAFAELGHPAGQARHYAHALYSAYLGIAALRRLGAAPPDSEDYIAALLAAFAVEPR